MEWSNDLILEFLELYEQEPCIWNPKHPQHKIRNSVNDSWDNISKNLSQKYTIGELKKKKDSLMATFRKLANRVKSSQKTGSGLDDIFKPDWFAYEIMARFLHGVCQLHTTKNSKTIQNETINNENENSGSSIDEEESIEVEASVQQNKSNENVKTPTVHFSPNIYKKRKIEQIKEMEKRLDDAYNYLKKASEKPKKDKCSLFCELLEKKLWELDEYNQDFAMLEIDKIVFALKQQRYASQFHNKKFKVPSSTIYNPQLSTFSTSNFHSQSPTTHTAPTPTLSQQSNLYTSPCTSSPALSEDTSKSSNLTDFQQAPNYTPHLSPESSSNSQPYTIPQSQSQEELNLNTFDI